MAPWEEIWNKTLRKVDHNTGILTSELSSLTSAGANSAVTGSHFDAVQVLSDNLGSAVASGIMDLASKKRLARLKLKEIEEDTNEYCPIPSQKGASLFPIPEGLLERFHEEANDAAYRNYIAQQLSGSEGYESFQTHLSSEQTRSLGSCEAYISDL